eukprot:m.112323 g.112323  ORF g.112323 m.112323 type:complete len:1040 (+) comp14087_c0_seq1:319-3438(+)
MFAANQGDRVLVSQNSIKIDNPIKKPIQNMSTSDANLLYSKGSRIWVPNKDLVYEAAIVKSYEPGETLTYETVSEGNEVSIKVATKEALPSLRNPDLLIGTKDLTNLSYLHEAAVLHNLEVRFTEHKDIYTYCGIVLVAVNPYERVPIYSADYLSKYRGATLDDLDPHIFAVAEDAYQCMARNHKNQSIIVSGESGAGKTVSAKFAMRYFAAIGGASDETQIEKRILASNPLMEAIGNAKTTRNDNSSRFGKYIEIVFDKNKLITGAHMRTYLLEKSRLVFQAQSERNYHIFYQLCASAGLSFVESLELNDADEFYFTFQGEEITVPGVDDAEEFKNVLEAMTTLGIDEQMKLQVLQILAGLLHVGNVEIKKRSRRNDDSTIPEDDSHIKITSSLLGLNEANLKKWLTNRKITTGREAFTKPLTEEEARFSCHAFAKHIYSHLFLWLVARINESFAVKQRHKDDSFIGVLDIYGFETFEENSYEQFCINYANEKLQQLFNQHIFKLEQDEYVKEKIEWSFIEFYDNQPCIDLIEDKFGILSLLDEECKVPKGNDKSWLLKMYQNFSSRSHFVKPRLSESAFIVKHYAGDVTYEADGFVDKNKDTLYEEHLELLKASDMSLLSQIFNVSGSKEQKIADKRASMKSSKSIRATVGTQFQESLGSLMMALKSTEAHYVRCVKPNDQKIAFEYDRIRCMEQLRACGVLETIRISAAGYPSRWTYSDFLDRYKLLANFRKFSAADNKQACQHILETAITEDDKFQLGRTKIFFRAGQVAYLERLRIEKMNIAAIVIQSHVKCFLVRRSYLQSRLTIIKFQAIIRGWLARRLARRKRETKAAILMQTTVRMWLCKTHFHNLKRASISMQSLFRGLKAREFYRQLQKEYKATLLQTAWRRYYHRRQFLRLKFAAIVFQSHYRRILAQRQLKNLRMQAKSVDSLKLKNEELQETVRTLQQQLNSSAAVTNPSKSDDLLVEDLALQLRQAEAQVESLKQQNSEACVSDTESLRKELSAIIVERDALIVERDFLIKERDQLDSTKSILY